MGILENFNPSKSYEDVLADMTPAERAKAAQAAEKPAEKPWDIRMSSVPTDGKEPLIYMTTRHAYLQNYLPAWKESLRFKSYSMVLAIVGLFALTSIPIVGIAALFGAAYYHMLGEFRKALLMSVRKVMWAQ